MSNEKEGMLSGALYDASDPELVAERRRAREFTDRCSRTRVNECEERNRLLSELLGSRGERCLIEPPFRCDYGYNLHVGDGFFANYDCVALDVRRIEIGRNCLLGPGVHLYTATHPIDPDDRTERLEYGEPVTIGDDVWIGGRAVVNPGVEIGDGSVVASGAVVIGDVPAGVVVGGNPARVVKEVGGE
ncbi:sugar O-acetyltransferase [Natronorarus salvus]|uniref:sugar O-acetyltransferase n=1 Tax=Natronorarus salvus TaxID=3117733 RepID=UPI002F26A601